MLNGKLTRPQPKAPLSDRRDPIDPTAEPVKPADQLTDSPPPLRARLGDRMKGVAMWLLIEQGAALIVRLVSNVVLARLLSPDAYGLVGLMWTLMVALGLFTDMGVGRTMVQSQRGDEPDFMNTAWTIQMIRGGVLALAMLLLGAGLATAQSFGWLAGDNLYSNAHLPPMVVVMSLFMILVGLESMRVHVAHRHMQQATLAKMAIVTQVASISVMVPLAYLTRSHWTLLAGSLTSMSLAVILQRRWLSGPPERLMMEPAARRELLGQARWIMPATALGFLGMHADRMILGGLVDATSFGLYTIAYTLATMPWSLLQTVGGKAIFPALSETVRERPTELPRVFMRIQRLFDLALVSSMVALAVCAESLVHLLYDARYVHVGPLLSILALGFIGGRNQVVEECYISNGHPQYTLMAQSCRVIALFLSLWFGFHWAGLQGAVVGVALSQFAAWPLAYWYRWRHGLLSWRADIWLIPAALGGALIGYGLNMALIALAQLFHR